MFLDISGTMSVGDGMRDRLFHKDKAIKGGTEVDCKSVRQIGIGVLVGAAVGVAIGLLYAPKSGKETRHLIKDKAGGIVETVRDRVDSIKGHCAAVEGS